MSSPHETSEPEAEDAEKYFEGLEKNDYVFYHVEEYKLSWTKYMS